MNIRINKFVAQATGLSRRQSDKLIAAGKVSLNDRRAQLGDVVSEEDEVTLDGKRLHLAKTLTIMLNKPVGYVCSRRGQGSQTIYELLPSEYAELKPVGRLDKDSSGLLLLTNDGNLTLSLTHPRYIKEKVYIVSLDKPFMPGDVKQISKGVKLADGASRLNLNQIDDNTWSVTMYEGRNRQIRRTFEALGYSVKTLHRIKIGEYSLGNLPNGRFKTVNLD